MKPILFNTPMVQAIMEDRKTQTRRLIKLPNYIKLEIDGSYTLFAEGDAYSNQYLPQLFELGYLIPKYKVGEVLYVRETWNTCTDLFGEYPQPVYKASLSNKELKEANECDYKWKPSIHMPKEIARIFLHVTNVRFERLQDIEEDDAKSEGCKCGLWINNILYESKQGSYIHDFKVMWNATIVMSKLHQHGWDANPWVFVYEFERIAKKELNEGKNNEM